MFKSLLILAVCVFGIVITQNETTYETTAENTNGTTTIQINTTSATTATTTAAPDKPGLLNFTIFKNQNESDPCLLLQLSVNMHITYLADDADKKVNKTATWSIPVDYNGFNGTCGTNESSVFVRFWNNWTLKIGFSLTNKKYELNSMVLNYYINSTWFPNASAEATGFKVADNSNLNLFSTNEGSSYKCTSNTAVELNSQIKFDITNYQGEPFYQKDQNKDAKFHTAVECQADQTGTSKLVPIIVGAALAFLVLLVLIAYLIGRRKHRSGYQSV